MPVKYEEWEEFGKTKSSEKICSVYSNNFNKLPYTSHTHYSMNVSSDDIEEICQILSDYEFIQENDDPNYGSFLHINAVEKTILCTVNLDGPLFREICLQEHFFQVARKELK